MEDDPVQAGIVKAALQAARPNAIAARIVGTLADAMRALDEGTWDALLLDLQLPDARGLAGLDALIARDPRLVIVVRTGVGDDATAIEAVRRGAQDYLVKGDHGPSLLRRSLLAAIERARQARERTGAGAGAERLSRALIESEARMVRGMTLARGPEAARRSAFEVGALIADRYTLRAIVGEGSSSRVYAAWDARAKRDVCVKHVHLPSQPASAQQLAREARLASAIQHPNVIQVLDFGSAGGEPYIVMEHAKGGSLADALRNGPFAPKDAARTMLDILRGLEHIHANDVIHLDLKPANVVLDDAGRAKITDFGVSLAAVGRAWDETRSDLGGPAINGTPAYVAPETLDGDLPTPLADIYSAGAVLHHLLSGRPYLDLAGLTLEEIRAAIRRRPPYPIPHGGPLAEVARRALRKEREERYPTARDMADAVERAWRASGKGVDVPVRSVPPRATEDPP